MAPSTKLTNGEAAALWITETLSDPSYVPVNRRTLSKMALASNPKLYTAKEIAKDSRRRGKICPANKVGPYIAEGLRTLKLEKAEDGTFSL